MFLYFDLAYGVMIRDLIRDQLYLVEDGVQELGDLAFRLLCLSLIFDCVILLHVQQALEAKHRCA